MDYRKIYTGEPDYGRAIEAYTQAIRRDPFDAASCLCRGRLYAAQDKYDQAFQDYDRAVGMKPDNAAAYALRGDAYLAMKRYDKAVEDYNHAIEIEDQPAFREAKAQAYYEQGCDLYAKEQFEDAIALYHKILSPNFAAAHLGLGMVHRAQKKYMEAIQDFNQVLEKDPANAAAYRYRGGVYFALASDVEQARIAFGEESRGIQEYHEKLEDYQSKLDAYKKQLVEKNEQVLAEHARQRQQKKGPEIDEYKRQLLGSHKQDIAAHEQQLQEEMDKDMAAYREQAGKNFAQWFGSGAKHDQALLDRQEALEKEAAQKREAYRLQLLEAHAQDIANYEQELAEKNSREAAIDEKLLQKQLEEELVIYEKNDLIKEFRLVSCCKQALEDYTRAIGCDETYGAAYYDRGQFYYALKEYGPAAEDFQKALEINPNDPNARSMLQKLEAKQSGL